MPTSSPILRLYSLAACVAVSALLACGGGGGGSGECSSDILVGDLVITEVMANPNGDDAGQEYIEIYNASSVALDLHGLLLVSSRSDGSDEKAHTMDELVIEPGDYVVVGGMVQELKPSYVDYGYGSDLGTLRNEDGGRLSLRCGGDEIDTMEYPSAGDDGVASGLDGNVAPDHLANDTLTNFCPATVEFVTGMFGSPGESNEPCNVVVPGMCKEGADMRAVDSPVAGDLVISEFLADPEGSDTGSKKEWFEVYVSRQVDLNGVVAGLVAGEPKVSVDDADCVTADAGSYIVFAQSDDPAVNGGLPDVVRTFTFTLKNGATATGPGSLFVGIGETVLDEITYDDTDEAHATALSPGALDPASNDDVANWVTCDAPYGDAGNFGTPGADNGTCDTSGMCKDGASFRPIVAPGADEILVTEVMANPEGTEPSREWVEITAAASFDLNGVQLGKDGVLSQTVSSTDCIPLTNGSIVVFAHTLTGDNDSLPQADYVKTFQLTNSGGSVVVGTNDAILHTLAYGDVGAASAEGRAKQLDSDGATVCFTAETTPYGAGTTCGGASGDGNCGTPGQTNPSCP